MTNKTIKSFPLEVILSVTTGLLLTKPKGPRDNGIGDVYELLGFMTEDSPYTHQLPRFADECKPYLLRWFPELENADVDELCGMLEDTEGAAVRGEIINQWLDRCRLEWGMKSEYLVTQINTTKDHTSKNPIVEMVERMSGA